MTEVEAAQARLLEIANELEAIHARLASLRASVPPTPMELDPRIEIAEMDCPTEVRSVIECVLHDWIGPAIRDLRAAAVYPRSEESAPQEGEPRQEPSTDDEDTWDETGGEMAAVQTDQDVALGTVLAVLRTVAGLDPMDLAAACGLRALTVFDYERGRRSPGLSTVDRILTALGFSVSALARARALIASLWQERSAARRPLPAAGTRKGVSPRDELAAVVHELASLCLRLECVRRFPRTSNGSGAQAKDLSDEMRSLVARLLADHLAPALNALESASLGPAPSGPPNLSRDEPVVAFAGGPPRALADDRRGLTMLVSMVRKRVAEQGGCILDLEEFGLSRETAREVAALGRLEVSIGLKAVYSPE